MLNTLFMIKVMLEKIRSTNWLYRSILSINSKFAKVDFSKLQTFFIFIGYPRSGHTLVGTLLDAHPNITCSIESNVLSLLQRGFRRNTILYFVQKRSKLFVSKFNYKWTKYSYKFDGLNQGESTNLIAIGDKKGAGSTKLLISESSLLSKLEKEVKLPVKMLHIIRNPYDNIATIMLRAKQKGVNCNHAFFNSRIEYYFQHAKTNQHLIHENPSKVLSVYHEDIITNPKGEIKSILTFIDVPVETEYLSICANNIYTDPHKTRHKIDWPTDLKEKVKCKMMEIEFFKRYSWND